MIARGLMLSGNFKKFEILRSSKEPIQQEPSPFSVAVRRRFWIAAAVSWMQ